MLEKGMVKLGYAKRDRATLDSSFACESIDADACSSTLDRANLVVSIATSVSTILPKACSELS